MRRLLSLAILVCAFVLTGSAVETASACPLCKEANETNPALPRAYMYSILFMLGMPALVLTGFGISFYRLSKSASRAAESHPAEPQTVEPPAVSIEQASAAE